MGAQKSIQAGKAKIDVNVDLSHQLREALLPSSFRNSTNPLSYIIGSLDIKHPDLFGRRDKLDVLWDHNGLSHSNLLISYLSKPTSQWLAAQQSFFLQHSVAPEITIHGVPIDNFSHSVSGGVKLSRFLVGLQLHEPPSAASTCNWTSKTSIRFEHVRPINDYGRSITRDLHGFPVTSSGNLHDDMIILKTESQYTMADDQSFSLLNFQIEQGVPLLSKWIAFNRFKFGARKGFKVGPAFVFTGVTGGSIVGDMAPYQAFSIGGRSSVRGYGEGAVGTGRACLVLNSELSVPLTKMLEGTIFLDCGTDLGSGRHVPGNPALRHGKPGSGIGLGYSLRCQSRLGQIQMNYAINAYQQKSFSFGISNAAF